MERKHEYKAPPWIKLDNAAKIYPPSRSRKWIALFRLSATLTEPVDPALLKVALQNTLKRIPSFSYRLRRGLFWYYMERIEGQPDIQADSDNPMAHMDFRQNNHFMFRVLYRECVIAVEIFHALTDGTGGLTFLLTLTAEYLRLKHGASIPAVEKVLDCSQPPKMDEMEDSFLKYARKQGAGHREAVAYRVRGTAEERGYLNITTGILPAQAVVDKAKSYGVSVTVFLAALLVQSIQQIQSEDPVRYRRRQPIKVSIPVNLRRFYGASTLRNFASYVNVGVNSALGAHTFEEILNQVKHVTGMEITEKGLNARMSANVNVERNPVIRALPLFIKAPFLKTMFLLYGDRYCSTTLSNLGPVSLPEEMAQYVSRIGFQLGAPHANPVVCSCLSYGDQLYFSLTRIIKESTVERHFFTTLVKMGIPVKIESNQR